MLLVLGRRRHISYGIRHGKNQLPPRHPYYVIFGIKRIESEVPDRLLFEAYFDVFHSGMFASITTPDIAPLVFRGPFALSKAVISRSVEKSKTAELFLKKTAAHIKLTEGEVSAKL